VRPAPPHGPRRLRVRGPRDDMIPRGNATSAWPLHRAALNRSQLRATVLLTPSGGRGSTSSRRRGASSTRSWLFFTKSWAWIPSPATDSLHKTSPCRKSNVMGTASGVSAVRLPISRTPAHQHRRRTGWHAATTEKPTRARTSTRTPTLTPCRSSDGRRRILLLRPCCCAVVWRLRPPRSDECTNN
jgi:hypothetical protein